MVGITNKIPLFQNWKSCAAAGPSHPSAKLYIFKSLSCQLYLPPSSLGSGGGAVIAGKDGPPHAEQLVTEGTGA